MKPTLFGHEPITSISFSNDEIIQDIMTLHQIDRFDLDCTYSIGQFWKNLPQPVHKTDLNPQRKGVVKASSDDLPFDDESMQNIMFDPPFVISGQTYKENKEGSSLIAKRFEGYKNFDALKDHYMGTLQEVHRILQEDGLLVFKCQDTTSSGKNHFSHCMVMNMAIEVGFYPKDLFILLAKNTISAFSPNKWQQQFHARKHHSYFWVFQKTKCKVKYT